jgi:hypothetical protein
VELTRLRATRNFNKEIIMDKLDKPVNTHAGAESDLNAGLAIPFLDFRPRAVCANSFIYGMLTGCGISFGTYGAMHLDGVTLVAAFFFLVFAKLAHEHIQLANVI